MANTNNPTNDFINNAENGDDDDSSDNQVGLLLRKRAVAAAAQLLLHNGIDDFWTIDAILEEHQDFFLHKLKRNVRREKLQTVLKLFGFRNVLSAIDQEDRRVDMVEKVIENDDQELESKILRFYEAWHYRWTVLVAIVETYYLIVIPFRCCFEFPRGVYSVVFESLFLDSIMYLNIFVRCFLPIEVGGVAKWKGKNENYVWSFWMFYDLVANFPIDYIGLIVGSKCTIAFNRCDLLAPYWQLNRLLNVRGFIDTTLEAIESILQQLHIHPYAALVVIVTLVQTYCWHLFACFLFLDVLRREDAFELIDSVLSEGQDVTLFRANMQLQYAASLDWASKVLAGWDRGSVFATDTFTFLLNAVAVAFGICLMTTFVAFVSGLVEMITPYIEQTMLVDMIADVVNYKKIPPDMRDEMMLDSWYRYDSKTHMLQASEVLGNLPEELHDRLLHFEGQRVLSRVTLFAPLLKNESFVINVAKQLKPVIMAPHEVLFEKGDTGESMYFLVDGQLGVVDEADHSIVKFRLEPGAFVGEIALLLGASRTATVVVLDNFVRMLSLNKKEFEELKRRFPNTFAQVHQKARDRWLELNQSLLDQAKEVGKKEIEEIAKKRFKLAQVRIHQAIGMTSVARDRKSSQVNVFSDGDDNNNNDDDENNNNNNKTIISIEHENGHDLSCNAPGVLSQTLMHISGIGGDHQHHSPPAHLLNQTNNPKTKGDGFTAVLLKAQIQDAKQRSRSSSPTTELEKEKEISSQKKAGKELATAMFGENKQKNQISIQKQNQTQNGNDDDRGNDEEFFERHRTDSQSAFMKQFLKDTMSAQPVDVNGSGYGEMDESEAIVIPVDDSVFDESHQNIPQQHHGISETSVLNQNTNTADVDDGGESFPVSPLVPQNEENNTNNNKNDKNKNDDYDEMLVGQNEQDNSSSPSPRNVVRPKTTQQEERIE